VKSCQHTIFQVFLVVGDSRSCSTFPQTLGPTRKTESKSVKLELTGDEDLGYFPGTDDRSVGCVHEKHDVAVDHVDCCCVQRRRKEDEEGLGDVKRKAVRLLRREVPCCVAASHH
jgi:hypothetical protein